MNRELRDVFDRIGAVRKMFDADLAEQKRIANWTPQGWRELTQKRARPLFKQLAELRREAIRAGTDAHTTAYRVYAQALAAAAPAPDGVSIHVLLELGRMLAAVPRLRGRLVGLARDGGLVLDDDRDFARAAIHLPAALTRIEPEDRGVIAAALAPQEHAEFMAAVQDKVDGAQFAAQTAQHVMRTGELHHGDIAAIDQELSDGVMGLHVSGGALTGAEHPGETAPVLDAA